MRTRPLKLLALIAALALALAACGGNGDDGADDGDGEAAAGDLGLVTEGTLTVCSDIPYAPFEFEEDGEFTGFDIELMRAIADKLGVELEVTAVGFDAIQSGTALNADQCDVAASAMTITEEREENLDFSEPYYSAEQSLLAPADSDISSLDDLAGQQLGVQSATTGEMYAQENAPDDTEIVSFENPGDLLTALQAGQVAAVLQDLPVNVEFAQNNEGFEIVETYDTGEQYGFAVAEEGSDELLEAINEALAEIRDEGTYDELYSKYFEADGGA